jgi:hypothetical protein
VSEDLAKNGTERIRSVLLRGLSEAAFLGTGLVSVINRSDDDDGGPWIKLSLGLYNPARGIQGDLVRTMSAMMEKNICLSSARPLVAAVDPSLIDLTRLTAAYQPCDPLTALDLQGLGDIEILNGRQRVHAARLSFTHLSEQSRRLHDVIKGLEEDLAPGAGLTKASERRKRAQMEKAKTDKGSVQEALQSVEFWPIQLYDKGEASKKGWL